MSNNSDVILNNSKSIFSKIKDLVSNKAFKKILRSITIIIFIIMGFMIILLYNKISYVTNSVRFHEMIYHDEGGVDLSIPTFQVINPNFIAGKFNVIQHLDGIKVNGIILNTKSVGYTDSEFEITVNGQTQGFQIKNIPSGYATEFNVFIPNVPIDKARWGNIKYIKGQIRYNINYY
jgi:hypothetical protein